MSAIWGTAGIAFVEPRMSGLGRTETLRNAILWQKMANTGYQGTRIWVRSGGMWANRGGKSIPEQRLRPDPPPLIRSCPSAWTAFGVGAGVPVEIWSNACAGLDEALLRAVNEKCNDLRFSKAEFEDGK